MFHGHIHHSTVDQHDLSCDFINRDFTIFIFVGLKLGQLMRIVIDNVVYLQSRVNIVRIIFTNEKDCKNLVSYDVVFM